MSTEEFETKSVTDEREAFEAYMASAHPGVNLMRRVDGEYWSTVPDNFWAGWQARAALAATLPAVQASVVPCTYPKCQTTGIKCAGACSQPGLTQQAKSLSDEQVADKLKDSQQKYT